MGNCLLIFSAYNECRMIGFHFAQDITNSLIRLSPSPYDGSAGSRIDELPGIKTFSAHVDEILHHQDLAHENLAIVYFNIDNFHTYNRRYGYEKGDAFLSLLAQSIANAFPDCPLYRVYVDHFLVLASKSDVEPGVTNVKMDFDSWNSEEAIELSSGIYLVDGVSLHPLEWLDRAKQASESLRDNPGTFFRYYNKNEETERDVYILSRFKTALSCGDVTVAYQPIARTGTRKLCSVEALARWNDSRFGSISPGTFIPILESFQLIGALDQFVVQRVCYDLRKRMDNGLPVVPVSMNFSYEDFLLFDVAGCMDAAVQKYRLDKYLLKAEITESMLKKDPVLMQEKICELHDHGYEVWMDDFGSGCSSLNVLHDFSFDEIKIDMKFLEKFDEKSKIIVANVVHMAKKLGMKTLAEGVETQEQVQFLLGIGCEKIQGYLLGRAEAINEDGSSSHDHRFSFENKTDAKYADEIGRVNLLDGNPVDCSPTVGQQNFPLAIYELRDNRFQTLFFNKAYSEVISGFHKSVLADDEEMNDCRWIGGRKILSCMQEMKVGQIRTVDYLDNGKFACIELRKLSEDKTKDRSAYVATIKNISDDSALQRQKNRDIYAKAFYCIHEFVAFLELKTDSMEVVFDNGHFHPNPQEKASEFFRRLMENMVHPLDQKRFSSYEKLTELPNKIEETRQGFLSGYFRIKNPCGGYTWKLFLAMDGSVGANRVMISVRDADYAMQPMLNEKYGKE